jgi:hypothetical protein
MTEKYTPQPFEALCQRYEAWVIKYCATGFDSPLYLIWYTDSDENNTDRILAYESGKMFAEKSLAKLKAGVWASIDNLVVPENVKNWLGNFEDLEVVESCTYDLLSIEHAIAQNNLDIATIEGCRARSAQQQFASIFRQRNHFGPVGLLLQIHILAALQ